jgi:signal transduction histidine kinase
LVDRGVTTANQPRIRTQVQRLAVPARAPRSIVLKRRIRLSLVVLLGLLFAVLGTGLFASYNLYRSAESHYVRVALPLATSTKDVVFQMQREETGVRGYMITTDRASLGPYFDGRRGVIRDLARIQRLTGASPVPAARLRAVRHDVISLHGFYDRLIAFVADGKVGQARARREVLNGEGLATRFRQSAQQLQAEADAIIARTRHDERATFRRTLVVLTAAGMLALAVGLALLLKLPERLRRVYAWEEQGANASRALAHVSDAVLLVDEDGCIQFWNSGAEQLFQLSAREAVGRNAADVIGDYPRIVSAGDDQLIPVVVDGEERWLAPAVSRFDGGSVLTLRDSTSAYVLERTRSDFVATASHELRTPLTTVFGGARTLIAHRNKLSPAQELRLLQMIEQESAHLVEIVDQLLVSAQLDRGDLHVHASDVDVRAVCAGVVESAHLRGEGRHALMLQSPTSMAPLHCDESLLRQVLINLVENAAKYSAEGSRIELLVRDDPGRVAIDVVDEGIGIKPADQERIFEKFHRLDADMSRGVGGSGLGLYISRELVTRMGGTLTVTSVPAAGSTFTVSLPRGL